MNLLNRLNLFESFEFSWIVWIYLNRLNFLESIWIVWIYLNRLNLFESIELISGFWLLLKKKRYVEALWASLALKKWCRCILSVPIALWQPIQFVSRPPARIVNGIQWRGSKPIWKSRFWFILQLQFLKLFSGFFPRSKNSVITLRCSCYSNLGTEIIFYLDA